MILRNIETCILRGYELQSFIFLCSESIPYFWRQRILYGTWCFFDRLQLFVEINSTDDIFTVVKIINLWFLGILWYAKYDGKSYGSFFSLTTCHFLDVDVKTFLRQVKLFLTGCNFFLKQVLQLIFSRLYVARTHN